MEAALGLMRTASVELISLGTNTLWNLSACDATRIHLINKLGTPRALCVCVCCDCASYERVSWLTNG